MYDFNKITEAQEKTAVTKFKEYGKGIVMGKYIGMVNDDDSAKWADLIDPTKYSENAIKQKMIDLAAKINLVCNDEFLGDLGVAFTVTDERDKKVAFTYVEMYTFLRAALRYRRDTKEYKVKKAKKAELEKFLEDNKTKSQKLREVKAELAKLDQELD